MSSAAEIDVETSSVHRTIRIDAARELVWAVLTSPDQVAQWFGQHADFPDGIHAGAEGTFGWTAFGDFPVRIETYEPHSRFAFTWGTPGEEILAENSTIATFTLTDEPGGTTLTVVETGFDTLRGDLAKQRAAMEDNAQGWTSELDELTAHVASLRVGRPAVADLETGTITRTVLVHAPQDVVWPSLTTPASIEAWWGHPAVFPDGVRPGSLGTFEWVGHGTFPVLVERVEPPALFAFRWGELGETEPGPTGTHVRFDVVAAGAVTLLTVLESGFTATAAADRRAAMERSTGGWDLVLDWLARFAEERA